MTSRQTIGSPGLPRPRVLVVDNKLSVRRDREFSLQRWKCVPVIVGGNGLEIVSNAQAEARQHRCHVALVDIRLVDDSNPNDKSGLELPRRLMPARSIIVSTYADVPAAREALKKHGAFSIIDRLEGPGALRQAIAEAYDDFCRPGIDILWDDSRQPDVILGELRIGAGEESRDELRCVLAQLYGAGNQDVSRVVLESAARHYGAPPGMAQPARSVVFVATASGRQGWSRQEIVKIGRADKIQNEIRNYAEYVASLLPAARTARIEDASHAVSLWEIGGIRYTHIASEEQRPFAEWYRKADAQRIGRALADLFSNTLKWQHLSETHYTSSPGYMYDYYVAIFPKLGQRLGASPEMPATVEWPGLRLVDPRAWVTANSRSSRFVTRWQTLTHGDLHSQNIFVDPVGDRTLVIDFERTGPGYYLRDLAELEADIRLRLMPLRPDQLHLGYRLDRLLLSPRRFDDEMHWRDLGAANGRTQAELRKAFDVVALLRKLAADAGLRDLREYYWALLMETMISVLRDYATWPDQEAAQLARDRATLSAALLCERLQRWDEDWPPRSWR